MSFDKKKYDQEYQREHITRKQVPFNTLNGQDAALLDWATQQGNFTQYVKGLILKDMMQAQRK